MPSDISRDQKQDLCQIDKSFVCNSRPSNAVQFFELSNNFLNRAAQPESCIGSRHEVMKAPTWVRCATRDGRPPQTYSLQYVEEADRVQRGQGG